MKKKLSLALSFVGITALVILIAVSCKKKEEIDFVPQLNLNVTSLGLAGAANSTDSFTVASNTDWTISSSQSWLNVSPTSGSKDGTVSVTAQLNADTATRIATVTVSTKEDTSRTVTVTQSGSLYNISVSRTSFSVDAAVNSTDTFTITSNTSWTVSSSQSWLTVSPTSGVNNGIVTVTATQPVTISAGRTSTLTISATFAAELTVKVTQNGIPCAPEDENICDIDGCTIPELPSFSSLTDNPYLPDPFTFLDGSRMTTKDEWTCRRTEIVAMAQEFEYGVKPCTPYSATTGSFSGNTLTVTVTNNGKTISFDCPITYPGAGSAPYPAMIGVGFSFLGNTLLSDLGVAIITFPSDEIAQENDASSRGKGKFYDFFCSNHSAGALIAWSWGVSRLIDAIEKTPAANIDPERLGVTGCSRWGKGALASGAFDERIVLTIPQESGSGGSTGWRISDYEFNHGQNTQSLGEIVNENCWFRQNFYQFAIPVNKLPFDHHMIEGLCAPRALLVIDNDILWLGPESSWNCANAAHKIWEALGIPDKMGYSGTTAHNHCAFPSSQEPELSAYVQKFLVGNSTDDTNIMKTEPGYAFDSTKWVNWTVPDLQ
jgi:hypothetical protein